MTQQVACALCGASETARLYTKFDYGIERCRRCALVYANPRAPEAVILARYSRDYFWHEYLPAIGAPEGRVDPAFLDARYAPMLGFLRSQVAGTRLLEVGTGAGLFLKAAERAGWHPAGLELSSDGVAFARERLGLDVRQERAEAMSFEPGTFDAAVMFDVIEHLFDPRAVLESTRRALRPGGLLVVSTPNFDALSRRMLGRAWAVLSPLEHLYYFTEPTLERMLASTGFSNIQAARRYPGWHATETMNYRYTHAPDHWRARAYGAAVRLAGPLIFPTVQRLGAGDALLVAGYTGTYG